jgi:protein required for attachment to host cells
LISINGHDHGRCPRQPGLHCAAAGVVTLDASQLAPCHLTVIKALSPPALDKAPTGGRGLPRRRVGPEAYACEKRYLAMKPIRTWVLIADAARARVFESTGKGTGLTIVQDMSLDAELLPSHELGTDRPGRAFDSVGSGRHAMEATSDPHREQKRQFARRVAEAIGERQAGKSFDRLVLVAPPVTMGDLRAALSDKVKARVASELVADLTNTPTSELPAHLAGHVTL